MMSAFRGVGTDWKSCERSKIKQLVDHLTFNVTWQQVSNMKDIKSLSE